MPLHGIHLINLHINRGHYHAGLTKTLCLFMLSWFFSDDFWLGPNVEESSSGINEIVHRWEIWASLQISVLLSVGGCLPDDGSHFQWWVQWFVCSAQCKSLSSGGVSACWLWSSLFFYVTCSLSSENTETSTKTVIDGLKNLFIPSNDQNEKEEVNNSESVCLSIHLLPALKNFNHKNYKNTCNLSMNSLDNTRNRNHSFKWHILVMFIFVTLESGYKGY